MNKQDLIKLCLTDKDAAATQPFKNNYNNIVVMRHLSNQKWFALIFEQNNKLMINLKFPPELLIILTEQYKAIKTAWHMNKKHWCTIDVNNISLKILKKLIKTSFDITAPKIKKALNEKNKQI